jgi:hypothetical protein
MPRQRVEICQQLGAHDGVKQPRRDMKFMIRDSRLLLDEEHANSAQNCAYVRFVGQRLSSLAHHHAP